MDYRLLEIVVCPICNGKLFYNKKRQELVCNVDLLAYPLHNGIPVLLASEAYTITLNDIKL